MIMSYYDNNIYKLLLISVWQMEWQNQEYYVYMTVIVTCRFEIIGCFERSK